MTRMTMGIIPRGARHERGVTDRRRAVLVAAADEWGLKRTV